MKLVKKLVILTGKGYAKGTVSVEKNALGIECRANLHNLRELTYGNYMLYLICPGSVHKIEMGSKGTAAKNFKLDYEADLSSLHCCVALDEVVVLYGTTESQKMWEANILDIIRRDRVESKKEHAEAESQTAHAQEVQYSGRQKDINNYFLDIMAGQEYCDDAIAEVNYYNAENRQKQASEPAPVSKPVKPAGVFTKTVSEEIIHKESIRQNPQPSPSLREREFIGRDNMMRKSPAASSPDARADSIKTMADLRSMDLPESSEIFGFEISDSSDKIDTASYKKRDMHKEASAGMSKSYFESLKGEERPEELSASRDKHEPNIQKPPANPVRDPISEAETYSGRDGIKKDVKINSIFKNTYKAPPLAGNISYNPVAEAAAGIAAKEAPKDMGGYSKVRMSTFYEQISGQIGDLFEKYERMPELEKIIPDSKWIKVDYDGNGKFYVIGVIGRPDYICYGVPAVYTPEPPEELDGYCQWLPTDVTNPARHGYWLLFQDAVTGESVKKEIM